MDSSFAPNNNVNSMRAASLQASQALKVLLAMGIAAIAAFCVGQILTSPGDNPVSVLLLVVGIILMFYALMRPWHSLLVFLWLVMTIDAVKRLTYAISNMSMFDVAEILAVPVLLMGGLYLRVFLLHWFVARREISKLDLRKFWPIMALFLVGVGGLLYKNGFSFGTLSTNYQTFCYIPAAIIVPHLLNSPERWATYSRQMFYIFFIIGIYGIIQSIHGPFDYEQEYLYSGLTSTVVLMEQESFRAFSLLNTSATYAGMMMICLFYSYYLVCRKNGRICLNAPAVWLAIFAAGACFLATQRGALAAGLLVLASIPVFSRPKMLLGLVGVFILVYAAVIIYAVEIKEYMYVADAQLEPLRTSHFMSQNFVLLTLGMRLDGFIALQSPEMWTPFGNPGIEGGHNLLADLLGWVGYVGAGLFLIIVGTIIFLSTRVLEDLRHKPEAYLWAQVNLAVFVCVFVWGAFLGSTIHVSPVNFFFWSSLGNILYLFKNKEVMDDPTGFQRAELARPRQSTRRDPQSLFVR